MIEFNMFWLFLRKKVHPFDRADRVVLLEDRLLKIGRCHFFIKAILFISLCVSAIVYKCAPIENVMYAEILLLVVLWVIDAMYAKTESVTYNEYVKEVCPAHAKQQGFRMAPVRGFLSCFLMSWDVTLFYVPFFAIFLALFISPTRISGDVIGKEDLCSGTAFDVRMMQHLIVRQRDVIGRQQERIRLLSDVCTNIECGVRHAVLWCEGR